MFTSTAAWIALHLCTVKWQGELFLVTLSREDSGLALSTPFRSVQMVSCWKVKKPKRRGGELSSNSWCLMSVKKKDLCN